MKKTQQIKTHHPEEFGLDILSGDDDLFRWFLLCYLFGKPIRSSSAAKTWELFVERGLDTPWAIIGASDRQLVRLLHEGGYTRYQHVTAHALHECMDRLVREYDGSLMLMMGNSETIEEFVKRLRGLYGVGPKVAEIFTRETEEFFARRVE